MRRTILLASLLLAACAPVVVTVPAGDGQLLPEQIQRAADAYTATARVQATQGAVATALRQQTLEAVELEGIQLTRSFAQTQDVISRTAVAATAAAQATAEAGATRAAGQAQAQATAAAWNATEQMAGALATETIRREQQRTLVETAGQSATFVLKLIGIIVGLLGVIWLIGFIGVDLARRQARAALQETALGPVLIITGPGGGVAGARLLTAPAAEVIENEPAPTAQPLRTIPRTVMGKDRPLVMPEPDDGSRTELVDLVRAAIAVEGEGSDRIPRYARMPDWATNPEGWKRLTDKLVMAGLVTKASGKNGGTFLTGGRTLYQLLVGLQNHLLSIAPVDVVGGHSIVNT